MSEQNVNLELTIVNNQIVCNSAEYVEAVRSIMPKFDYIVDKENLPVAKDDMKKINKFIKDASRKRIDTEKELLKEWIPHKETLMQIEKELKACESKLEEQVKALEEQEKEEIVEFTLNLVGTQKDFTNLLKHVEGKTKLIVKSFKTKG